MARNYDCLRKLNNGSVFNDDYHKRPFLIKRYNNWAIYVMDSTYYMDLRLRTFKIDLNVDGLPQMTFLDSVSPNNDISLINFGDIVWDPIQKIGCYMYSEYNGSIYDRYAYYLFWIDEITGEITLGPEKVMSTTQSPDGQWSINRNTGAILHCYETYPGYLEWSYHVRAGRINGSTELMEWGSSQQIETLVGDYGRGGRSVWDPDSGRHLLICGEQDYSGANGYSHTVRVVDVTGLTVTLGSKYDVPYDPEWNPNPADARTFIEDLVHNPFKNTWILHSRANIYLAPGVLLKVAQGCMTMFKVDGFNLIFGSRTVSADFLQESEFWGDLQPVYTPLTNNWQCFSQENQYSSYDPETYHFSMEEDDNLNLTINEEFCYERHTTDEHLMAMWCPEVNAIYLGNEGYNTYYLMWGIYPEEFWTNWQGQTEFAGSIPTRTWWNG